MKKLHAFEPVIIHSVRKMPPEAASEKEIFMFLNLQSLLVLPMKVQDRLIGFVGFDSVSCLREWKQDQIHLLDIVSGVISNCLLRRQYESFIATEKKMLDVTLQSISEGLIVTDNDQRIILFSRAAEAISGWTSEEVNGMLLKEIFILRGQGLAEPPADPVKALMEKELVVDYLDPLFLINKFGEKIAIYASCSLVQEGRGVECGYVIVFNDIKDQIESAARQELNRKLEAIGMLASGIAHEINTPIYQ